MGHTAAASSPAATRPALALLLTTLAFTACDSSNPLTSSASSGLERVEVTPASAELAAVAPWNTVSLTTTAWDDNGEALSSAGGIFAYQSSAPSIASVSPNGVVTGLTPGIAQISVALNLNGVTRTTEMQVQVLAPGVWPNIGGVYDLTATITDSDPGWGIEDGTRQLAVVTIQHFGNAAQFTGTFSDFRAIAPNGDELPGPPGSVSGVVNADGRIVLELTFSGSPTSDWSGDGFVMPDGMSGRFGAGGHSTGSFIANRR